MTPGYRSWLFHWLACVIFSESLHPRASPGSVTRIQLTHLCKVLWHCLMNCAMGVQCFTMSLIPISRSYWVSCLTSFPKLGPSVGTADWLLAKKKERKERKNIGETSHEDCSHGNYSERSEIFRGFPASCIKEENVFLSGIYSSRTIAVASRQEEGREPFRDRRRRNMLLVPIFLIW